MMLSWEVESNKLKLNIRGRQYMQLDFASISTVLLGPNIRSLAFILAFITFKGQDWLTNFQRSFFNELFYIGVLSLNFDFSKHLCSKN